MEGLKHKWNAITYKGVTIAVQHFPDRKLPKLTVQFEGEATIYSIASFNSEENAKWFLDVIDDLIGVNSVWKN